MYIICSRRLTLGLTVPLWHHRGRDGQKRFYPGRIQWYGQKQAGKTEVRVSGIRTFYPQDIYCQHLLFLKKIFLTLVPCLRNGAALCIDKWEKCFKCEYALCRLVLQSNTTSLKNKHIPCQLPVF